MAWYATTDDRVLGIIVRDRLDDDYGWVVLTRAREWHRAVLTNLHIPPEVYRCVDTNTSHPSMVAATEELHRAMHAALEEAP
jgi:hypothetical protein